MKNPFSLCILGLIPVVAGLILLQSQHRPASEVVEVGRLATRDHVITLFSDGNSNFFKVAERGAEAGEGVDLLDESALKSEYPKLYEQVTTGIAGNGEQFYLWAGRDLDFR